MCGKSVKASDERNRKSVKPDDQSAYPEEWDDDQKTLIYGMDSETMLSPEELRRTLGLPAGSRIEDYKQLAAIGIGGMGAVFSAYEPGLNREVALKILRPQYRSKAEQVEWFIREARATAQIDHPNIPPVHRMGVFDDVGVYFTMKRVDGETLRTILRKLEENRKGYRHSYTLRRLLEIFIGVCNGVAFAHSHGLLHCDLKPGNIMIGDYGEVMVMDWGMARYSAERARNGAGAQSELDLEFELGSGKPNDIPSRAVVGGTPAFMAPEQLTGEISEPAESSDLYGLGAILYTILTWKKTPFDISLTPEELQRRVAAGRIVPPRKAAPSAQPIPLELEAICLKAMARDRSNRYRSVTELLTDVRNYLDGYPVKAYSPTPLYRFSKLLRRRPLIPSALLAALLTWFGYYAFIHVSSLSQSTSLITLAEFNYTQAKNYGALAMRNYNLLREKDTSPGRTRELETELLRMTAEQENGYNSSLEFISRASDYGLRETKVDRMCRDIFKSNLEFYLKVESYDFLLSFLRQARLRWKTLFDRAISQDPALASLVARIDNRLGSLEITGRESPGRKLTIRNRENRIVWLKGNNGSPEEGIPAAELPIGEDFHVFELPTGLYTLEITNAAGQVVRAPVQIALARGTRIGLTQPEKLPPGVSYVPGGEFFRGVSSGRMGIGKSTLPPFMIGRHEVSFAEYLAFWTSLTDEKEKKICRGWFAFDADSEERRPIWDAEGDLSPPFRFDLPVVGISGEAAERYCAWLGKRLGMTCRLPTRLEWEKAARGVDARTYVWGNDYEPGYALLRDAPRAKEFPVGAPPGKVPADISGYGVSDLAGNVREFVRSPGEHGKLYTVVGGSYASTAEQADTSNESYASDGAGDLGFRYVIEVPGENE